MEEFDAKKNPLNFAWDNSQLTSYLLFLDDMRIKMGTAVDDVEKGATWLSRQFSLWALITLLGDVCQILTSAVVIFGILGYSRFLGLIGTGIIVVPPRKVYAFMEFVPNILPDWNTIFYALFMGIVGLINYIVVFITIIMLILFIKYAWYRTIKVKTYYGTVRDLCQPTDCLSNWTLEVNLLFRKNNIRQIIIEYIYLKVPISVMKRMTYKDLEIINPLNGFYISKEGKEFTLNLVNRVHIAGYNNTLQRVETKFQTIEIPVNKIHWAGGSLVPTALSAVSDVNIAIIKAIKDSPPNSDQ